MSDAMTGAANAGATAVQPTAGGAPINVTAGAPGAAAAAPAAASDWTAGLSEDLRGYVMNKGFKEPGAVVDSYRNFEKLMGVPQDRILKLPEKADDVDSWNQIYDKLGRPQKPEEYQIPTPANGRKDFTEWAQKTFHKHGLSRTQAEKVVADWNEYVGGVQTAEVQQHNTNVEAQEMELKKSWGAAYEQNINVAKQAVREFGLDAATIDKLEDAMGYAGVIKFMQSIGSKIGEDSFVSSGSGSRSNFSGVMAPEAARNQIESLKGDSDFVRRYVAGDVEARNKMQKLHEMAYPDHN